MSLLERPEVAAADPQVLPLHEIDFSDMPADRPRIVSFEGKWVEDSAEFRGTRPVPCQLTPELQERVAEHGAARLPRAWICATTAGWTCGWTPTGSPGSST